MRHYDPRDERIQWLVLAFLNTVLIALAIAVALAAGGPR